MAKGLIAIVVCLFLSGCGATVIQSCAWVTPIYPSKDDVLTRGTKQQIITHNETVEKQRK